MATGSQGGRLGIIGPGGAECGGGEMRVGRKGSWELWFLLKDTSVIAPGLIKGIILFYFIFLLSTKNRRVLTR